MYSPGSVVVGRILRTPILGGLHHQYVGFEQPQERQHSAAVFGGMRADSPPGEGRRATLPYLTIFPAIRI